MWLFGGLGTVYWESRAFAKIDQYDLWKFDPSTREWAWMGGNSTSICGEASFEHWCGQDGIYGSEGTPAIANIPPSRDGADAWKGGDGNFWLFGGEQAFQTNLANEGGACNDVWVFEPAANEWAWMNGAAQFAGMSCSVPEGTYGVQGTPAVANTPSGRVGSAHWTDQTGNLWLFGGYAVYGSCCQDSNELWVYEPVTPAPTPSFELTASPNPINIGALGAGAPAVTTGTTTVDIVAAGGFNSPVTLTATPDTMDGVTDITGSFNPASVIGAGSSTLTISVTGAAILVAESIPLTINGTSGSVSQSIQVIVDVTSPGLAPPSFSVPAGIYPHPQTVSISDTSLSAYGNQFIYYTLDGTAPTAASPVYVNPITVSSTATLKAMAMSVSFGQSAVSSAAYVIASAASAPAFSLSGGTYNSVQTVKLSDSMPGATIYYTTNGATPGTSSTKYSAPISVTTSETVKAIAAVSGIANSPVVSAAYTLQVATPSFSPNAGTYNAAQSVRISDSTPSAVIYYTTNNTTPGTGSAKYSAPISVTASETIKAIAVVSGFTNSGIGSSAYVLQAAAPTFSPAGGTYGEGRLVTIASTTPGAVIHYTTDGGAPTSSSAKYTAPVPVTASQTIKAIAVAPNFANSTVSSATYTLVASPQVLTELATGITATGATLNATINDFGIPGQVWFQWGPTGALGNLTAKGAVPPSAAAQPDHAAITGLTSKTNYYFRPVCTTAGGTTYGAVQLFTTN